MNLEFLDKVIHELSACNADFEVLLQEEVAVLKNGIDGDEGLLKDIEFRSEQCRQKMDSLKDLIFKTLISSGCVPDEYLRQRVSECFTNDDSYVAASKIAGLLEYYKILNIRVDTGKIVDCVLRASKGNSKLLAEILSGMRRDFRDFYTWGWF